MLVYLVAFGLTILFIQRAAFYYNKILKLRGGNGDASAQNLFYDKEQLREYKLHYYLYFLLAFFPLFFVAAVRYDVGTDYFYTYVPNFLKILKGEEPYSEWGFNQLNKFIQLFTDNPQWLFVVTGLIYSFVLIQTIVRYSENVSISVLVVLFSCIFFVFLNNMRQSISVILFLRAFPYIVKGEFFKYLICVLLGCIFHFSAVIMIIPCVFANLKIVRKNFALFAIAITVLLPVLCKVMEIVLMNTKYEYFFVSHFNDGNVTTVNIVYHFAFFVLSYIILGNRIMKDKKAFVLLFMQFLAFWVSCISIFIRISEMISRLTVYFQVYQILLVPYCVKVQKDSSGKALYLSSYFIAYGLYLVYYIVINGYHHVLPYQWIF